MVFLFFHGCLGKKSKVYSGFISNVSKSSVPGHIHVDSISGSFNHTNDVLAGPIKVSIFTADLKWSFADLIRHQKIPRSDTLITFWQIGQKHNAHECLLDKQRNSCDWNLLSKTLF